MYRRWNTAGKSLNGRGASDSFVTTRSVVTRKSRTPNPPPWQRWCLIALLVLILSGCTRARYRNRADNEVYGLIGCAMTDPRWVLKDYSINPSPESRMFDPDNPDRPPMPPDDPTSAELMRCVDGKRGWPHWD
ncbi:MAG: hypothetical protein K8R46_01715, partial [Pirellulales bacterium]|nr:hypothetical protein [Pirellulales bacterium]